MTAGRSMAVPGGSGGLGGLGAGLAWVGTGAAGAPGLADLSDHRRVDDQVPEGRDGGHVAGAEPAVRLDQNGQLTVVASCAVPKSCAVLKSCAVPNPAQVQDAVHG